MGSFIHRQTDSNDCLDARTTGNLVGDSYLLSQLSVQNTASCQLRDSTLSALLGPSQTWQTLVDVVEWSLLMVSNPTTDLSFVAV